MTTTERPSPPTAPVAARPTSSGDAGPRWRVALESVSAYVAPLAYAISLTAWAASWNLRLSVLMAWMPFEPIWVTTGAVALCVVHRLGQPVRLQPSSLAPIVLLCVCFLPGVLRSSPEGYGPTKVASMVGFILPMSVAALILLDSSRARRAWVVAQVSLGLAVTAVVETRRQASLFDPGRLTLATVDTISTGRLVGLAASVLLLVGLARWRHAFWAWPLAGGAGVVLVAVGSRGPALFALAVAVLTVAVARCFNRRRLLPLVVISTLSGLALLYARRDGGAGGGRITGSLRDGLRDDVRERLLRSAVELGLTHPGGIGWGDFAQESPVGLALENRQQVSYAHNIVAEVFSEGGILALLALVILVAAAIGRLWRASWDPWDAMVLAITIYWFLNAQVSYDIVGNRFMWLNLAVGMACVASPRRTGVTDTRGRGVAARTMQGLIGYRHRASDGRARGART